MPLKRFVLHYVNKRWLRKHFLSLFWVLSSRVCKRHFSFANNRDRKQVFGLRFVLHQNTMREPGSAFWDVLHISMQLASPHTQRPRYVHLTVRMNTVQVCKLVNSFQEDTQSHRWCDKYMQKCKKVCLCILQGSSQWHVFLTVVKAKCIETRWSRPILIDTYNWYFN